MDKIKRWCIVLGIIVAGLLTGTKTMAATPRVMVSGYEIAEGKITTGKEFTLKLTLNNTSPKVVKNMLVSVLAENGEFIPVKNTGTVYVDQIDAESEKVVSFPMKAIGGLDEKSYKISIKIVYENTGGYEYREEETVFLPVHIDPRIEVTRILPDPMECQLGDTVEFTGEVNNLSTGTIYNVRVAILGTGINETDAFLGNIETGKSAIIDLITNATKVSSDGQSVVCDVMVTYEDRDGNAFTEKKATSLVVRKPDYQNLEKVKVKEGYNLTAIMKIVGKGLLILALIGAIGTFFYRRKKRKEKLLEEFIES